MLLCLKMNKLMQSKNIFLEFVKKKQKLLIYSLSNYVFPYLKFINTIFIQRFYLLECFN